MRQNMVVTHNPSTQHRSLRTTKYLANSRLSVYSLNPSLKMRECYLYVPVMI